MARTHTTDNARKQREILRIDKLTSVDRSGSNKLRRDLAALEVDGDRFGNHRKMYAKLKVVERRHERARLNREVMEEA